MLFACIKLHFRTGIGLAQVLGDRADRGQRCAEVGLSEA